MLIHDNLDQVNLVGIFDKTFKGGFFPDGRQNSGYFPGEKEIYKVNEICFDRALFKIFGYYWGYVLNEIILRILGFIGIFILLMRINRKYFKCPEIIILGISLAFVFLPHHPRDNLGVLGIPLLVLLFQNIYLNQYKLMTLLFLFLYPFYSRFATFGFFSICLIGVYLLFCLFFKREKFASMLIAFLIYTFGWIISNYSVFLIQFAGDATHRSAIQGGYLSFGDSVRKTINVFLHSQYHAHSLHDKIIIPSLAAIYLYLFAAKKRITGASLSLFLISYCVLSSFVYGFYYFKPLKSFIDSMHIGFQFNRFYFFNAAAWYFLWAIAIYNFILNFKYKKTGIILMAAVILMQIFYSSMYRGFPYSKNMPAFREFMSEEMFDEIKKQINYKGNEIIGCVGFFPSVANYNGFKTVGAYSNLYSNTYKQEFRKIIKGELEQNESIRAYFDNWGNRAYLFDDIIGKDVSDQERIKRDISAVKCDLDLNIMYKMGVRYIFSTVRISNSENIGLKLIYLSDVPNRYYRMFVYKLDEYKIRKKYSDVL